MNVLQRVGKVWDWFKKNFESLTTGADSLAVVFTEHVQTGIKSNLAGFLTQAFDQLTHTKIAENALAVLKTEVPRVIATELAIQGVGINPTEADFLSFENRILAAFNVTVEADKHYAVIAAQIYKILHVMANKGAAITFADAMAACQDMFNTMQQDLNDGTIPTGNPVPLPNKG